MPVLVTTHWNPHPTPEEKAPLTNQVAIWVSQGKTDGELVVQGNADGSTLASRVWSDMDAAQEFLDWLRANMPPRWTHEIREMS